MRNKKETIEYLIDVLETSLVVRSSMDELGEEALLAYLEIIDGILGTYIKQYNSTGNAPLYHLIKAYGLSHALHEYYFNKKDKGGKNETKRYERRRICKKNTRR